ncbi:DUF2975 domain-containing protein [Serinicoccus sp. LYQ131]|uniref:DUF2975 domain-containing protein n=1 Tax=Serinicoccus sp. LYQ131 TaxID=3378797 RepID=UPI0038534517
MLATMLAAAHVALPLWAESLAMVYPEVDYLRVPFLVILGACAVAGEIVLLTLWTLAPALSSSTSSTPRRLTAVVLVVVLLLGVAAAFTGLNIYLSSSINANPPLVGLGLLAGALVCGAVAVTLSYAQWHHRQGR